MIIVIRQEYTIGGVICMLFRFRFVRDYFRDHASVTLPGVLQTNVGHSNFTLLIEYVDSVTVHV